VEDSIKRKRIQMIYYSKEVVDKIQNSRPEPGRRNRRSGATALACVCLAFVAILAGCASTEVREVIKYSGKPLPRPERIFVYDFAVSPDEVKLSNWGVSRLLHDVGSGSQTEEQFKVGREVSDRLAAELVKYLSELGLPAERAKRGTKLPNKTLAIDGQFVSIDTGSTVLRMVIGFGAGGSEVRTLVQVYMETEKGQILLEEFDTKAESSKKPGLGATMGAGAAVGVLSAAGAAVGGATSGALETQASVEADARRTAKEVTKRLTDFFNRQGWITSK